MHIRVLGSGAGGGFPQWNCNCANCAGYRQGTLEAKERSQSSIIISENGKDWILINASPDIRQQLANFPALQPARQLRDTSIKSIILVDAQLDHTAGLLFLREGENLAVYCTRAVQDDLTNGFPVFPLLTHYCGVTVHDIPIENQSPFSVKDTKDLQFIAIPLVGKAPPYSSHRQHPQLGDNIGLLITHTKTKKSLFYAPGIAKMTSELKTILAKTDCILIDGTFFTEDEMIVAGVGNKLAQEMGHIPQSGEHGMLTALADFPHTRRILIHINNTNPIINPKSPEFKMLTEKGFELAYDGMEINLSDR